MRSRAIAMLALQLAALLVAADSSREDGNSLQYVEGKLTKAMDELNRRDSIGIFGDMVSIEKVAEDAGERSSEESADPLVSRIEAFLRTRRIQVNLPDDSSTAGLFGRALGRRSIGIELRSLTHGTSEARTKLKKMILPLLVLLKFKTLVILPIVITVVGLIGIKGLGGAFLSLLLSGAVALKALVAPPPPPRVTYGVVRPHEIHHDHWHRSEQDGVDAPYRGWAPEYNGEQYQYHEIP
ncbi:uncharacterized protein LOC105192078 [Harpegnathos saltator]|uniref:Osiris 20 n=1 Tax=Harpegnathos saltator TaxID=610380 RepID=E2B2X3_HARSA|nr:uncharacterized protein LOC105192078 [Harpegnathos saltator]EFN89942.1 hypothetical protein EAI_15241 [Harpegnathos saltator]